MQFLPKSQLLNSEPGPPSLQLPPPAYEQSLEQSCADAVDARRRMPIEGCRMLLVVNQVGFTI